MFLSTTKPRSVQKYSEMLNGTCAKLAALLFRSKHVMEEFTTCDKWFRIIAIQVWKYTIYIVQPHKSYYKEMCTHVMQ